MKVLLTGATGFIGGHLLTMLQRRRHALVCPVRRRPPAAHGANISYLPFDGFEHAPDLRAALSGCDAVIHLAGRAHVVGEAARDPLAAFNQINAEGTLRLARQALEQGVRRFIFVSSIKVNGDLTTVKPFGADDAPAPADAYARSKQQAEAGLLALRGRGMDIVIVRPPLVYGPGVRANFLQLMQAVRRGIPLPFGAVENRRSLVYVGNLCDLLLHCLHHARAADRVWLVSDDRDLSTAELVRMLARAMHVPARLVSIPPALLRAAATLAGRRAWMEKLTGSLQVDVRPTMEALNWTPPYSTQAGLFETAHAFLGGTPAIRFSGA